MWELDHCAATDLGRGRTNNEDFALLRPDLHLFAVADGMGGHAAGEIASSVGSAALAQAVAAGEPLDRAVECAHLAVLGAAASGRGGAGMGSTLVVLKAHQTEYEVAWVGDSRAYLYRAANHTLEQVSRDHSYVQMLLDAGLIDSEQSRHHPERNIITQCLGAGSQQSVQVDTRRGQWCTGDVMLLCSDGLSDNVELQHMLELFQAAPRLPDLCRQLIDAALAANAQDNITAVLVSPVVVRDTAPPPMGRQSLNRPKPWLKRFKQVVNRLALHPRSRDVDGHK